MQSSFQTLRWGERAIELLDQRALPQHESYLAFASAHDVAQAIRDMVVRGAPAIGCAAAYGVAVEALRLTQLTRTDFDRGMDAAFHILEQSRPTAANLFWALHRMKRRLDSLSSAPVTSIARDLLEEAHSISREDVELNRAMGRLGAALLPETARVLTHCNAGALATAGHGTALGIVRSAVEAGKRISVYADETRPFLQGARLTAWELQHDRIPVTLIADSAAGLMMSRGLIDAIIVGADRVAANGDVANKVGTYPLAVLARRHAIPFYVACPMSTIDVAVKSGDGIPIEERSAEEVLGYAGNRWAPEGISVANPVFDVTPAELVTALVTEKEIVLEPDASKISKLMAGSDSA